MLIPAQMASVPIEPRSMAGMVASWTQGHILDSHPPEYGQDY